MDEVENPALPVAGESSPTIRPVDQGVGNEDDPQSANGINSQDGRDTAESLGLFDNASSLSGPPTSSPSDPPAAPPSRPGLRRETSAPPPQQPPPAPPSQPVDSTDFTQDPPDSLTLADLKRIRSTFPNAPAPQKEQLLDYSQIYDFEYRDAQSLPVELEEWFSYSEEEELRLRSCRTLFNEHWRQSEGGKATDWMEVAEVTRRAFIEQELETLRSPGGQGSSSLMILVYIALGVWEETAGRAEGCSLEDLFSTRGQTGGLKLDEYRMSGLQIQWIVGMVKTLHACGALKVVLDRLQAACEESFAASPVDMPASSRNDTAPKRGEESAELWSTLTLMYIFLEVARTTDGANGTELKRDILALEPKLINFLTQVVAKMRWDEVAPVPLTKMLLLCWKAILVTFGGIADVEHVKASMRSDEEKAAKEEKDARGQPIITASPLDYHLFRQEISSKYPAYQPPAPLFPLEPENNSILPPLKHRRPSSVSASDMQPYSVGTGSIMHQPVHIATPAPSPPPSPAGPGKAGKKQNYQTNQMFPFLYPPLDATASELGGKGSTLLQDTLVGRRWQGSDVPTSILEAADLFSKRMRATRGMRQLWDARVDFMEFERGWNGASAKNANADDDADVDDGFELVPKPKTEDDVDKGQPSASNEALSTAEAPAPQTEEERKLAAVGQYYEDALPHLQSVVIVLLKAMLHNVTDLVTQSTGQNGAGPGLQAGIQFNDTAQGLNGTAAHPVENGTTYQRPTGDDVNGDAGHGMGNAASTEMDRLRTQEVAAKALSAILLLLLKWFKAWHVLAHEYMTSLLLDSNYVPLVLKLWQTQDMGRTCHFLMDNEEAGFWYFCRVNSRQGVPMRGPHNSGPGDRADAGQGDDEDVDDAVPPPIKSRRGTHSSEEARNNPLSPLSATSPPPDYVTFPPEVDELGYPVTAIPPSPLKAYSYRNVFSAINFLRVLQKVTRRKTHRALLLVSYKSGVHLKKTLRVPVGLLRYYTLKLFKSQVPFCGRKWRQGNMKIITAVWLSVPAELRDDWLAGGGGGMGGAGVYGDVDGSVEDAVPLEQGLRELTHWWNMRNFPDVMGFPGGGVEGEDGVAGEVDFFARELERIEVFTHEDEAALGDEQISEDISGGIGVGGGWAGPLEGY